VAKLERNVPLSTMSLSPKSKITPFGNTRQKIFSTVNITLSHIPTELLETILTNFCDGYTLNQFWLAVVVCRRPWDSRNENEAVQDICRFILRKCLARRRRQIMEECNRASHPIKRNYYSIFNQLSGVDDMTRFTQQISRTCFTIDYFENIPLNVVWCGKLSFRDPRCDQASGWVHEEEVNVALFVDPYKWICNCDIPLGCYLPQLSTRRTGCNDFTARDMILQNYNFVPIAPHGRIVGITAVDRSKLRRVSQLMNRLDLVGTLPCSYHDRRSGAGSLVCRMMSFAQAQTRIERTTPHIIRRFYDDKSKMTVMTPLTINKVAHGKLPPNENFFASNNFDVVVEEEEDDHTLYCSWERVQHEDAPKKLKKGASIFDCYRKYCQLKNGITSTW
jgi:hypothetical protein